MSGAMTPEESLAEGFSRQLVDLARDCDDSGRAMLAQAARAISLATSDGHVCVNLREALQLEPDDDVALARTRLQASGLVAGMDSAKLLPLVIDSRDRLYLARYFDYERRLAGSLMARASTAWADPGDTGRDLLDKLFAANRARLGDRPDWQKIACAMALGNRLTVIAGGPGTGKTTTLVNLLAALLELQPQLRVALAAPTGKAAQRMREAMTKRAAELPEGLRNRLPEEVHTVHRLLGAVSDRRRFRHHAGHPLPLDLLVVDEASMLDLALATRLLEAVASDARVIFLGDKDQLAAVEAGAVFHEMCSNPSLDEDCRQRLARLSGCSAESIQPRQPEHKSPLRNCTIWLEESLRYDQDSGIGQLAAEINRGDAASALARLASREHADLAWLPDSAVRLKPASMIALAAGFDDYREAVRAFRDDASPVFAAFDRFRVLCAVRGTERGAVRLNENLAARFRESLQHHADDHRSPWFPGRPVMITSNDYGLGLFNGDIGLCLPASDGSLVVYFSGSEGTTRTLAPARLPPHESAFALTVHKSQGSEFGEVAFVLPAHDSRVLTRELIYTAVTRARSKVSVYGTAGPLARAIAVPTQRNSGLLDRLAEVPVRAGSGPRQGRNHVS